MANLGIIATGVRVKSISDQGPRWALRSVVCGDRYMVLGGREETEANVAPSLRMDARGTWRFRWVVQSGARALSVNVKQAVNLSPRPRLTVKANTAIGVNADVTADAASSVTWTTVTANVTPTLDGVLEVILEARYDGQPYSAPCYWDTILWS